MSGGTPAGPIGALRSIVLAVDDMDAACRFYTEVLGYALKVRDGDRWATIDAGGVTLALAGAGERPPDPVALSIKVADVAAALRLAVAGGASLVNGPTEGPHEIRAAVRDPAGHLLYLYSPR